MEDNKKASQQIDLPRTYRHLQLSKGTGILFILFVTVPSLIGMFLGYSQLSTQIATITRMVLQKIEPEINLTYEWFEFVPGLGPIQTIVVETRYPSLSIILINIAVMIVFLLIGQLKRWKIKPFWIYIKMMSLTHFVSCLFFLFASDYFPYTAADYSELYIKQQIGIWICFIAVLGLVFGILGTSNIWMRIISFCSIMGYSFVFGVIRYIIFMYVLYKYSVLYMTLFFFVVGPFFDFLYLVAMYSVYVDKNIRKQNEWGGKGEWVWS